MDKFIEFPCFVGFLGESCFSPPPPPLPPTEYDWIIPEADGLDDWESEIGFAEDGGAIIGIAGVSNSSTATNLKVTIGGQEVEQLYIARNIGSGTAFSWIGALPAVSAGDTTIKVEVTAGSAGRAAIRQIDTEEFPLGWKGRVYNRIQNNTENLSGAAINMSIMPMADSLLLGVTSWIGENAYPISAENFNSQPLTTIRTDEIGGNMGVGFHRLHTEDLDGLGGLRVKPWHTKNLTMSSVFQEFRGVVIR